MPKQSLCMPKWSPGTSKQSLGMCKRSPGTPKKSPDMRKWSPGLPKRSLGTPKWSQGTPKQCWEKLKTLITSLFLSFEYREKSLCYSHIFHIWICKKRFKVKSHFKKQDFIIQIDWVTWLNFWPHEDNIHGPVSNNKSIAEMFHISIKSDFSMIIVH